MLSCSSWYDRMVLLVEGDELNAALRPLTRSRNECFQTSVETRRRCLRMWSKTALCSPLSRLGPIFVSLGSCENDDASEDHDCAKYLQPAQMFAKVEH